ncbi:response regulator transcription factor [Sphingomonas abietis]|uniref:Response regulator transcription factor n=1 Tax=Sphingomonas abietis TaxID=3012344 RepID=A0ABY7NK19_9SPHN|nr:response regulator transcription factor [Sphingomonas abietis]WBO21305.1 response regulator transcription factor [Sphingomonas abietis]
MKILVVEDDAVAAAFIVRGLDDGRNIVAHVATGHEALDRLTRDAFDVVVLDRMIPGMDGVSVLAGARAAGVTTPMLMLTALGSIEDRVQGLDAGADDYLTKPFAMSELIARLHAIVRRRGLSPDVATVQSGRMMLHLLRRELRIDGDLVPLQPREFRLLEELVRNAGRIVSRSMLLEAVWNFHFEPQTNIVESHMSRLRTKLGLAGVRDAIETVRGAGYRLRSDEPA